ncbi:MAG: ketoacyl-ACP synthase III [Proteobacteria bacterium]|nr:ketoacyl-ACP synthase III [Pseudomonadota bacterium]MBT5226760.1 ketoacyl-ACP synthase III [Pseudomonadota bacterium]MBT5818935.1 ketoacyl-ACP synthase III [Pseudomonadota bacterium]MBT6350341.1 ketoacyl-ACP synthase III [Pseudomonadota bacterium]MCH1521644.1 ketoacyl-ACP synthase III [Arenicellales bacterium]
MSHSARITGTGSYLPQKVLTNKDLEQFLDTTEEWIFSRSGIRQRHIAAEGEFTSDLAEVASREALKSAGRQASDVDLIVVATTTADQVFPSTACLLQNRLGIHGCPAFDVQAVCAGFLYAMDVAYRYIMTGASRCALVVGAETFSRILNWEDRSTCVLFGDGAGAVLLEAADTPGILSSHIHADGAFKDLLCVPVGVSTAYQDLLDGRAYTEMQGKEVFRWAVSTLGDAVIEILESNGIHQSEIDWLVPHQANIRIINAIAKRLELSMDQVVVTIDQHGNTSAASVPLAFDTAVRDGRIKSGDKVIFEAFGGGFTWGSMLVQI